MHIQRISTSVLAILWLLLQNFAVAELKSIEFFLGGHKGLVSHAVFSPDSSKIATVSENRIIKIWDANDGSLLHTLAKRHSPQTIANICFESDDVLVSHRDDLIDLWDANEGIFIRKGKAGQACLMGTISPDGTKKMVLAKNRGIFVSDADTGDMAFAIKAQKGEFVRACFSPENDILTIDRSGSVDLWHQKTGCHIRELTGSKKKINLIAISSNLQKILAVSKNNIVRVRILVPDSLRAFPEKRTAPFIIYLEEFIAPEAKEQYQDFKTFLMAKEGPQGRENLLRYYIDLPREAKDFIKLLLGKR